MPINNLDFPIDRKLSGLFENSFHEATTEHQSAETERQLMKPAGMLSREVFAQVVAAAPLIAIDLIVQDAAGKTLLGMRTNPPAKGYWFVPGGRIRKNETIAAAFERLALNELGQPFTREQSEFMGVFEHFYDTDFRGDINASTHYVVLAYLLRTEKKLMTLPTDQHTRYQWLTAAEALSCPDVHSNTKSYFFESIRL